MDAAREGSYRRGMNTSTFTPTTPAAPPAALPRPAASPLRRLAIGAGVVIIVTLFAFGGWGAIGFATLHRAEQHQHFAFTGSRIVVDSRNGAIRVSAGQAGQVEVDTHLHYSQLQTPHPTARVEGDQLILTDGPRGLTMYCDVGFDLRVPATVALQLNASNGAVSVSGVSGALQVRTSNGAVQAQDLRTTALDVTTSNGAVTVSFLTTPSHVGIRTSNGRVQVTVPRGSGPYKLDVTTSNGSRTVAVPSDPAATSTITVHASNGSVRVVPAAA